MAGELYERFQELSKRFDAVQEEVMRLMRPPFNQDPDISMRNQIIGYLKGKANVREDEAANAPSSDARQELTEQAATLRLAADDLEHEQEGK